MASVRGYRELMANVAKIKARTKEAARTKVRVGIEARVAPYRDGSGHPGTVAVVHEYQGRGKKFFRDSVKDSIGPAVEIMAEELGPDMMGGADALEGAGEIVRDAVKAGISRKRLIRSGRLRSSVRSRLIRD